MMGAEAWKKKTSRVLQESHRLLFLAHMDQKFQDKKKRKLCHVWLVLPCYAAVCGDAAAVAAASLRSAKNSRTDLKHSPKFAACDMDGFIQPDT